MIAADLILLIYFILNGGEGRHRISRSITKEKHFAKGILCLPQADYDHR